MPYIPDPIPQKDLDKPGVLDLFKSGNVFINNTQVALYDKPNNVEFFMLGEIADPKFETDKAINELDGEEDETVVDARQQELIKQGVITQYELDQGKKAAENPSRSDTATTSTTTVAGTSTTVSSVVDDTLLYESTVTNIKYYVKTVTKQPGVIFPYDVETIAPQNGTTVQEVVNNLTLLVKECFDKIKAQFPDAFMTCSFRKKSGNGTSQHPFGMACDIQYSSATKADYFTRAQWIRENVKFDQFILEYKTTGSGKPWHHISVTAGTNRRQVFTFMNDKNCKGPGVQGLYDLSNG